MRQPPSSKNSEVVATDTSTIINLTATGCAAGIVLALRRQFVVVDSVQAELEAGQRSGHENASLLKQLIASDIFRPVRLNDAGLLHFESLVVGPAVATLDDGEAATIAYALSMGTQVAIDERKASTICSQRFPNLIVSSTVDLLSDAVVEEKLGRERLSEAVFRALLHGRMQVSERNIAWVLDLIGREKASACTSLSKAALQRRTTN